MHNVVNEHQQAQKERGKTYTPQTSTRRKKPAPETTIKQEGKWEGRCKRDDGGKEHNSGQATLTDRRETDKNDEQTTKAQPKDSSINHSNWENTREGSCECQERKANEMEGRCVILIQQ